MDVPTHFPGDASAALFGSPRIESSSPTPQQTHPSGARRAHPGTSSRRRVASDLANGYTRVVLRRDDIPLVAQAYFTSACDTLDATRMSNRGAIMTEKKI